MFVERYHPDKRPLWDEFVNESKNGTFLFLRDYMDYHGNRFKDHSLMIYNDRRRLTAVVPANEEQDTFSSHSGLTYGGVISDVRMKTPIMLDLFDEIVRYLRHHDFRLFAYKTVPHIYHVLPAEEDRYALFLLGARYARRGVLSVLRAVDRPPLQERRVRGIKKALNQEVAVRETDDFDQYWEVLTENLHLRYDAEPVHTLAEMQYIRNRFRTNIRLFAAFVGQELVAGTVIYESRNVARTQYIASNEKGQRTAALDVLFHVLLNYVYRSKAFFDFGTSDEAGGLILNKGLIELKEGFGARAVMLDTYHIDLDTCESGIGKRVLKHGASGSAN